MLYPYAVYIFPNKEALAQFVWTVMKTHCLTNEIIEKGFSAHPLLAAEIMEFQQEHRVDASQLAAIRSEMEAGFASARAGVQEAKSTASSASRTAETASRQSQQSKQDFGNVKTDIKNLMSRNNLK